MNTLISTVKLGIRADIYNVPSREDEADQKIGARRFEFQT